MSELQDLIHESIRLSEEAQERAIANVSKKDKKEAKEIKKLEEEADILWKKARELGTPLVDQRNYDNLMTAIVQNAIEDYEDLISGGEEIPNLKSIPIIEEFLKHQVIVKIHTESILNRIRNTYENEFIPYVRKHKDDIVKQWRMFEKKRLTDTERRIRNKHKCPLCGNVLRPRYKSQAQVIGCQGCKLWY